jgi:hypothetical protein
MSGGPAAIEHVRSVEEIERCEVLFAEGLSTAEVARRTGIPRTTVRTWRAAPRPTQRTGPRCARCGHPTHAAQAHGTAQYAYLLGLYLGDGTLARHARGVYRLDVTLDERYPGIVAEAAAAIAQVLPGNRVSTRRRTGCLVVGSYSRQWPCLFPQHGPGRKHERAIVLVGWQRDAVERHTEAFLRGLVHSDGCRATNTVHRRGRTYAYPRYQFCNASEDIRRLFTDACDRLGVRWTQMNARNVSVARRAGVARLDAFIGPKR